MKPFKLLRLPTLAQANVFQIMSNEERLDTALTSKRMKRNIHAEPRLRENYQLSVCFRTHEILVCGVRSYRAKPLLEGKKPSKTTMLDGEEVPFEDEQSPDDRHQGCIERVFYFDANMLNEGFRKMCLHFLQKLEITTVDELSGMRDKVLEFRQTVERRGIAVKTIKLIDEEISSIHSEAIFSFPFLKDLIKFKCLATPPMAFRAQPFPESISMKVLYLAPSEWFEINHLLTLKWCENIYLDRSLLTSKDINDFMTAWKNGNFKNLASMTIETTRRNKLDFVVVAHKLANRAFRRNNELYLEVKNQQGQEAQVWISEHQFRCKVTITIE
ncbi:hypothetical protein CAEBREN_19200 [Caenorhabditis brenneri]|uniref:Sdz-33 F-box domain-containing protein n=1 Tax=Caenorhabditis brenneri TaxID=135651 RepID=G0NNC8_CAEBE|nr:hypothetical protein CAEBREN_19200 [Caenorhabditis brenneri]